MDTALRINIDGRGAQQGGSQVKQILNDVKQSAQGATDAVDKFNQKAGDQSAASSFDRVKQSAIGAGDASESFGSRAIKSFTDAKSAAFSSADALSTYEKGVAQVKSSFDNLSGSIFNLRNLLVGLGIAEFAKSLFDTSVAGMQMITTLRYATGSAVEAAKDLQFVRNVSDAVGTSFQTSAIQFSRLEAAAKGTTMAGAQVRDIFRSMSAEASILHLNNQQVYNAFLAIDEMISKGTVNLRQLRIQLGNDLPGAMELAAQAMGVTVSQLDKMASKGELLTADFLPRFSKAMMDSVNSSGALGTAMNSPLAALNRLQNAWFDFKTVLANSGFMDAAISELNHLTAAMTPDVAEQFGQALQNVIPIFTDLGNAVLDTGQWMLQHKTVVLDLAEAYIALKIVGTISDLFKAAIGTYQIINALKLEAAARTEAETAATALNSTAVVENSAAMVTQITRVGEVEAALTAEAAEVEVATGATTAFGVAIEALGGPIAWILGALALVVTAFIEYGNSAETNAQKAAAAMEDSAVRTRKAINQEIDDHLRLAKVKGDVAAFNEEKKHDSRVSSLRGEYDLAHQNTVKAEADYKTANDNRILDPQSWTFAFQNMLVARQKEQEAYKQYQGDLKTLWKDESLTQQETKKRQDALKLEAGLSGQITQAELLQKAKESGDNGQIIKIMTQQLTDKRNALLVKKSEAGTEAERLQIQKQINGVDAQIKDLHGHVAKGKKGTGNPGADAYSSELKRLENHKKALEVQRFHATNENERLQLAKQIAATDKQIRDLEDKPAAHTRTTKSLGQKRYDFEQKADGMIQAAAGDTNANRFATFEKEGSDLNESDDYVKGVEKKILANEKLKKSHQDAQKQANQWDGVIRRMQTQEDGYVISVGNELQTMTLTGHERERAIKQLEIIQKAELEGARMDEAHRQKLQETVQVALREYNAALDAIIKKESDWHTGAIKAMNDYMATAANTSEQTFNVVKKVAQGVEDALVTMATNGKFNFRQLADSIIQDIIRMEVKASESSFMKYLQAAIPSLNGGGGNLNSMLPGEIATESQQLAAADAAIATPHANGGVINKYGDLPLKKYGGGGVANSPQLALYGEAGTEAFVPLPDGRTIPVTVNGTGGSQGGASVVINQNISIDARGADASVDAKIQSAMQQNKEQTKAEILDNLRRGGVFAKATGTR